MLECRPRQCEEVALRAARLESPLNHFNSVMMQPLLEELMYSRAQSVAKPFSLNNNNKRFLFVFCSET